MDVFYQKRVSTGTLQRFSYTGNTKYAFCILMGFNEVPDEGMLRGARGRVALWHSYINTYSYSTVRAVCMSNPGLTDGHCTSTTLVKNL